MPPTPTFWKWRRASAPIRFGASPLSDFRCWLPFLFATLRLNFGVSWKVALTAELLGGNSDLGFLMNLAMQDQNRAAFWRSRF